MIFILEISFFVRGHNLNLGMQIIKPKNFTKCLVSGAPIHVLKTFLNFFSPFKENERKKQQKEMCFCHFVTFEIIWTKKLKS